MKKKILSFILVITFILPCAILFVGCDKPKRIGDCSISINTTAEISSKIKKINSTTSIKPKTSQEFLLNEEKTNYSVTNAHRYNKGSVQIQIVLEFGYNILKSNVGLTEQNNKDFEYDVYEYLPYTPMIIVILNNAESGYNFTINKLETTNKTELISFGAVSYDQEKTLTDADYALELERFGILNSLNKFSRIKSIAAGKCITRRISLDLREAVVYLGYDSVGPTVDPASGITLKTDSFTRQDLETSNKFNYTQEQLDNMIKINNEISFSFDGFDSTTKLYKFSLSDFDFSKTDVKSLTLTINVNF